MKMNEDIEEILTSLGKIGETNQTMEQKLN